VRAVRLLVWAAGAALCGTLALGALHAGWPAWVEHRAVISYAAWFVAITIGVLVWELRPDSRTGMLLTAFPLVALLGDLDGIFWKSGVAVTIGLAATTLPAAIFVHLTLSYPTGRLTARFDRGFVVFMYGYAVVYTVPLLLFFDPRFPHQRDLWECVFCAPPLTYVTWLDVEEFTHVLDELLVFPLAAIFLVLLARKLVRATPGGRRIVLPLFVSAVFVTTEFAAQIALYGSPVNSWTNDRWFPIVTLATVAVPVALAAGMLWGRVARSAVADLVVELEHTPPGSVRDALARTLGDPTLELALWLPERSLYVDAAGHPVELPAAGSERGVTVLGPAAIPVAALVHDPVLFERRSLLEAAGAAARLALENERLQAELRAQLAELHASRARIVHAGDEERRRLERDLHDGAQQRLLGLGLALQLARTRISPEANGAVDLLTEAEGELRAALDELRELARGIHPAILTDQGLGAALRSLAERSTVPVTILAVPEQRLDEPVEVAAYFVVSESLANVAKYAQASAVRVSVTRRDGEAVVDIEDDGVGGADPTRGSGLRGLVDRVQALDGRVRIESPAGHGTRVHAEIPCVS
jgi:signal transduction histidine kinase